MDQGQALNLTHFKASITAGFQAAQRDADRGQLLARQVVILAGAADLLSVNFAAAMQSHDATREWLKLNFYLDGFYQQLHATSSTATILVARSQTPRLKSVTREGKPTEVDGLAALQSALDAHPEHPLNPPARRIKRELALLRWLCDVRNRAVQHRAERGYTMEGFLPQDHGIAVLRRATEKLDPKAIRNAAAYFRGLERLRGKWNEQPSDEREALVFLDWASHELWDIDPAAYEQSRRLVKAASAYDLVFSLPLIENADAALAAVIGLTVEGRPRLGAR